MKKPKFKLAKDLKGLVKQYKEACKEFGTLTRSARLEFSNLDDLNFDDMDGVMDQFVIAEGLASDLRRASDVADRAMSISDALLDALSPKRDRLACMDR